jgi:anaerobic dimethyl sulfoxide reductase subunit A
MNSLRSPGRISEGEMNSNQGKDSMSEEKVVMSACSSHCGGVCLLKVHVKDGQITKIENDEGGDLRLTACLRGRAYRQRVYAPDRLKVPMKRVGSRGEGKFERISWDEALDTVAGELIRVRDTYGPGAIILRGGGGDLGLLHRRTVIDRLLGLAGGYSQTWGYISFEGGIYAELATLGTFYTRNTRDNLLHSRLILLWGWDPANTIQDSNTCWYLVQAKEAGAKIISVDPRYTDTAAAFAHQWIPARPGTDAAMLVAMAYVKVRENLQDQKFLDTYTVGFDHFKNYVLGSEDGIPKTPVWAERITGAPAASIEKLAVEYATTKPAALVAGIGPGRTAYGEQYHRAAITLAAMTGNIGVRGGDSGGRCFTVMQGFPFCRLKGGMKAMNPVDEGAPLRKYGLRSQESVGIRSLGRINTSQIADAILKGKKGGYPFDYKLLYVVNSNYLNQSPDLNKTIQALKQLEFVVVQEQFMTATAKFADILLPVSTFLERNDITIGEGTPFIGYMGRAIEPLYESKSQLEIATLLAARMEISNFSDKTEDEWLRTIAENSGIPDYHEFKERGIHKVDLAEPYVEFRQQIEDPVNHPFPTPSGKIEIYSRELADMGSPEVPPIPKYIPTWEGPEDSLLIPKYPLQLITTHFKRRAHTQFETLPWLKELQEQVIQVNSLDARARRIRDGDRVRVFNDRGEMVIRARVTERIMPGVVDLPQGAWYDPDSKGIDKGGCANVLTSDRVSPGGAVPYNTGLVQVEKI